MTKKPFKMKGNPMQRNFGIGGPIKQESFPLSEYEKEKGTTPTIISSNVSEDKKEDLERRIALLQSDLKGGSTGTPSIMNIGKQITKLEAELAKLK
mgnify:CR=1 FL=1